MDTRGGPRIWAIEHSGAARGRKGNIRLLSERQRGTRPYWMPYFTVVSLDQSLDFVSDRDGTVITGPVAVPAGRFAVVSDPQGALLGLFEGEVDD